MTLCLFAGAVVVLGAVACQTPSSGAPPTTSAAKSAPAELGAADSGAGGPGADSSLSVPGMDFSRLSVPARKELANVFSDEFCYCGCPHSLGACLRQHTQCRHAKRMAALAARHAEAGFPSSEIILILSRYYDGFREPRKAIKVDPRMCQGNENAPVTLVEFFDYECPFCINAHPLLQSFAKKYAAKVRFCAMPFPLSVHPNAIPAAHAALMARDAGKFWAMHDGLFEVQGNGALSVPVIKGLAGQLGLNGDELGKAIAAGKYQQEIDNLRGAGKAAGVDSTPTLFLNGRKFQLDITEENLIHTVDDELEWTNAKGSWAAD